VASAIPSCLQLPGSPVSPEPLAESPTESVELCRDGAVVGTAACMGSEYSARPSPTGVNVPARAPALPRNLFVMQITIVFKSLIQSSGPESTYLQLL